MAARQPLEFRGAPGGQGCRDGWRGVGKGRWAAPHFSPTSTSEVLFKSVPAVLELAGGEYGLSDLGGPKCFSRQLSPAGAVSLRRDQHELRVDASGRGLTVV